MSIPEDAPIRAPLWKEHPYKLATTAVMLVVLSTFFICYSQMSGLRAFASKKLFMCTAIPIFAVVFVTAGLCSIRLDKKQPMVVAHDSSALKALFEKASLLIPLRRDLVSEEKETVLSFHIAFEKELEMLVKQSESFLKSPFHSSEEKNIIRQHLEGIKKIHKETKALEKGSNVETFYHLTMQDNHYANFEVAATAIYPILFKTNF